MLHLVAEALSRISGTWEIDRDRVVGPGTVDVIAREHRQGNAIHPDLGFVLNRDRQDVPVLWDCAAGTGRTEDEALRQAIHIWSQTTGLAALELLTHTGEFATHCAGDDPDGFPGWHAIHAPILGWGDGDRGILLQQWAMNHPLLPLLHTTVAPALDRQVLNGIKVFFGRAGGDRFAEVRVNGIRAPGATRAIEVLDWPEFNGFGAVRTYVILVQREAGM